MARTSGHVIHCDAQLYLWREHVFEQLHLLLSSQRFYALRQLENLGGHPGHRRCPLSQDYHAPADVTASNVFFRYKLEHTPLQPG
jgi:hypothetical protein